jgi:hypothetical protein
VRHVCSWMRTAHTIVVKASREPHKRELWKNECIPLQLSDLRRLMWVLKCESDAAIRRGGRETNRILLW